MSLEKTIPYGQILGLYMSNDLILIVTPAWYVLMNWNLEEKKRGTNRYQVDRVL